MDEYLQANQKLWDQWTIEHEKSPFYDLAVRAQDIADSFQRYDSSSEAHNIADILRRRGPRLHSGRKGTTDSGIA